MTKQNPIVTDLIAVLKADLTQNGGYLDVGKGAEIPLGVAATKLVAALKTLTDEGYPVYYTRVSSQDGTRQVSVKVLALPATTYSDVVKNRDQIRKMDTRK